MNISSVSFTPFGLFSLIFFKYQFFSLFMQFYLSSNHFRPILSFIRTRFNFLSHLSFLIFFLQSSRQNHYIIISFYKFAFYSRKCLTTDKINATREKHIKGRKKNSLDIFPIQLEMNNLFFKKFSTKNLLCT